MCIFDSKGFYHKQVPNSVHPLQQACHMPTTPPGRWHCCLALRALRLDIYWILLIYLICIYNIYIYTWYDIDMTWCHFSEILWHECSQLSLQSLSWPMKIVEVRGPFRHKILLRTCRLYWRACLRARSRGASPVQSLQMFSYSCCCRRKNDQSLVAALWLRWTG